MWQPSFKELADEYRDAAVSLELESDQPDWETDKINLEFAIERMCKTATLINRLTGNTVDWESDVEYVVRHSGWTYRHGEISFNNKLANAEYPHRVASKGMRIDHSLKQKQRC